MLRYAVALFLASGQPPHALAQDTQDQWSDRVTINAIDPFKGYPAASTSRHGGSRIYVVDMTTALQFADGAAVSMIWSPQGTAQSICFEHATERRCRLLDANWDPHNEPRFKPTKSDHWPTLYVSFTNLDGRSSLIVYTAGEIMTGEEEVAKLRALHDNRH